MKVEADKKYNRRQFIWRAKGLCFIFPLQLQDEDLNEVVALIVQYLPYLTITVLNFSIPIIFARVVVLEDYSHNVALRITLAR